MRKIEERYGKAERIWLKDRGVPTVEIEAAFQNLKDDLALRPILHQLERRIEAHIFVAFLAYCLQVTLRARLRPLAPRHDPTCGSGQVRRHPDARCALPDDPTAAL